MLANWTFEPIGPMGGATGNAFVNTLQGSGLAPAAELAREAIQNSCDAAKEGERRVRVVFRIENREGEARQRFLDNAQLEQALSDRMAFLRLSPESCLSNRSRPLTLVFVEDYGTTGLSGDPHSRTSHFHRLLLSVGDSAKALSRS
ncbi:hypothetical protein, partial [Tepidiforma sp.]|uniref:hypothetical protein n=1 Tax=Tepidiforma sp. TaxID=2682230 RepID=UPI002ADDB067